MVHVDCSRGDGVVLTISRRGVIGVRVPVIGVLTVKVLQGS